MHAATVVATVQPEGMDTSSLKNHRRAKSQKTSDPGFGQLSENTGTRIAVPVEPENKCPLV
jgi:hypothetical protein